MFLTFFTIRANCHHFSSFILIIAIAVVGPAGADVLVMEHQLHLNLGPLLGSISGNFFTYQPADKNVAKKCGSSQRIS